MTNFKRWPIVSAIIIVAVITGSIGSQVIGCTLILPHTIQQTEDLTELIKSKQLVSSDLIAAAQQDIQSRAGNWADTSVNSIDGNAICQLGQCRLVNFDVSITLSPKIRCLLPDVIESPGYVGFGDYDYSLRSNQLNIIVTGSTYLLEGKANIKWNEDKFKLEDILIRIKPYILGQQDLQVSVTKFYILTTDRNWEVNIRNQGTLVLSLIVKPDGTVLESF